MSAREETRERGERRARERDSSESNRIRRKLDLNLNLFHTKKNSNSYEEYVPVKKRRELENARRLERLGRARVLMEGGGAAGQEAEGDDEQQQLAPLPEAATTTTTTAAAAPAPEQPQQHGSKKKDSLLVAAAKARATAPQESASERLLREEQEMLKAITAKAALKSARELAKGIEFSRAVPTGWTPPAICRCLTEEDAQAIRDKHRIVVEGEHLPAPVVDFEQTRAPGPVLRVLASKGISRPTPIQMQGLPVILSGRDLIGIAFTGSGKTLAFSLPAIMLALQEEARLPLRGGEGPLALILAPSRELARQTSQIIDEYLEALAEGDKGDEGAGGAGGAAGAGGGGGGGGGGGDGGGAGDGGRERERQRQRQAYPALRSLLCVGGVDSRAQSDLVRDRGVHIATATPGRLKDLLGRKRLTLDACRFLCLDEADRMVDLGFEDDLREILGYFKAQRQTLMFSATMPAKIRAFANSALVDPATVNVGRSGAANLDVIQEVEYVKQEAKLVYLLECLQKTAPPVMVFAENQRDVDDVHEYLLLKGVEAAAVHGGKDQDERSAAIDDFKAGRADVLVATDVASKGLDFPDIQHVINFDMPREIENYVHRIGRTGRCGKTGVATTFVNKSQSESVLLDLKHLLREAKQRVPPVLAALEDPMDELQALADASGTKGCAYCGGLGHRIADCPKLDTQNKEAARRQKDYLGSGGFGGEM